MEIKKTERGFSIYRYKYFISNDIMSISMHHIKIEKMFCLGFSIDLFSEVLNITAYTGSGIISFEKGYK